MYRRARRSPRSGRRGRRPGGEPAVRMLHWVDFGTTAAMTCLTTGLRVTGDEKRSSGGPCQSLMAEVVWPGDSPSEPGPSVGGHREDEGILNDLGGGGCRAGCQRDGPSRG